MYGLTAIQQALQMHAQSGAPDAEIIILMIWMMGTAFLALLTDK